VIPGVRAVWPADDTMEVLLQEGLAQRHDHIADPSSRHRAHHEVALEAIWEGRGVVGSEGRAALEEAGLYTYSTGDRRTPSIRR
jgi:hypothetical protein